MSEKIALTAALFDIITRLRFEVLAPNARHLEHPHRAVEHSVHHLEPGSLVAPHGRRVACVS